MAEDTRLAESEKVLDMVLLFLLRPDKPLHAHFYCLPTKERLMGAIILQQLSKQVYRGYKFKAHGLAYFLDTIDENAKLMADRRANSSVDQFTILVRSTVSASLALQGFVDEERSLSCEDLRNKLNAKLPFALKSLLRTKSYPGDDSRDTGFHKVTEAVLSLLSKVVCPPPVSKDEAARRSFFLREVADHLGDKLLDCACFHQGFICVPALEILAALASGDPGAREILVKKHSIPILMNNSTSYRQIMQHSAAATTSAIRKESNSFAFCYAQISLVSLFAVLANSKRGHGQLIDGFRVVLEKCCCYANSDAPQEQLYAFQSEAALFTANMTSGDVAEANGSAAARAFGVVSRERGRLTILVRIFMMLAKKFVPTDNDCSVDARNIVRNAGAALAALCDDQVHVAPIILHQGGFQVVLDILNAPFDDCSPVFRPYLLLLQRCSTIFYRADNIILSRLKKRVAGIASIRSQQQDMKANSEIAQHIIFLLSEPHHSTGYASTRLFADEASNGGNSSVEFQCVESEDDSSTQSASSASFATCDIADVPALLYTKPKGKKPV
uniref:Uncharacterized protein n=1 Tax=Odontella aurita TaxID=265563 RepID=A0A6U6FGM3_9STRA